MKITYLFAHWKPVSTRLNTNCHSFSIALQLKDQCSKQEKLIQQLQQQLELLTNEVNVEAILLML
jgi:hypothetical protein